MLLETGLFYDFDSLLQLIEKNNLALNSLCHKDLFFLIATIQINITTKFLIM